MHASLISICTHVSFDNEDDGSGVHVTPSDLSCHYLIPAISDVVVGRNGAAFSFDVIQTKCHKLWCKDKRIKQF